MKTSSSAEVLLDVQGIPGTDVLLKLLSEIALGVFMIYFSLSELVAEVTEYRSHRGRKSAIVINGSN